MAISGTASVTVVLSDEGSSKTFCNFLSYNLRVEAAQRNESQEMSLKQYPPDALLA